MGTYMQTDWRHKNTTVTVREAGTVRSVVITPSGEEEADEDIHLRHLCAVVRAALGLNNQKDKQTK